MSAGELQSGFENTKGNAVEMESGPVGRSGPAKLDGIVTGAGCAAGDAAEIVGDDVVIANAAVAVAVDAVEELDQGQRFDRETGLLEGLAAEGFDERFAEFDQPAGDRPAILHGFMAAPDEQNTVAVEKNGSDADERSFRIFALHGTPWNPR